MNKEKSINSARERFDHELHTGEYKMVHENSDHLNLLLKLCNIEENEKILDLGTGNGYVAFELAKKYPNISIVGLDITESSINRNNKIVESDNLKNIKFYSYDGMNLPFEDNSFTKVVSRYAFHHFPELVKMIKSLHKKLANQGQIILSDVLTYDSDTSHFIDSFQALKKDGHIHFYHLDEINMLLTTNGFTMSDIFFNEISFSRELTEEYKCLLEHISEEIKKEYKIQIHDNKVFITVTGYSIKAIKNE